MEIKALFYFYQIYMYFFCFSVERDRLRERERQARAQMSQAGEREPDAGAPLFGAPVKVTRFYFPPASGNAVETCLEEDVVWKYIREVCESPYLLKS